jgi:uncharacterized protein
LVGAAILACTLASQVAAQSGTGSAHVALTPLALNGRVADAAHIFDPAQTAALASDLAGIEARTGRQVVVATVQTLGDADIAVYARDLGNRLGIGGADENDGIVILLAPNERLVRIAVGPGLEADLTDTVCQRIIDEVMLPDFREGRLFEGLSRGVAALNARM